MCSLKKCRINNHAFLIPKTWFYDIKIFIQSIYNLICLTVQPITHYNIKTIELNFTAVSTYD